MNTKHFHLTAKCLRCNGFATIKKLEDSMVELTCDQCRITEYPKL